LYKQVDALARGAEITLRLIPYCGYLDILGLT